MSLPLISEIQSPAGNDYAVWTREGSDHFDCGVDLIFDYYDEDNLDHVKYHGALFHPEDAEAAESKHAEVVAAIEAGEVIKPVVEEEE